MEASGEGSIMKSRVSNSIPRTLAKVTSKGYRELPYNPEIPLFGIYPKKPKTLIWKNICTTMFIAELFTRAKIGSSPGAPQ